MLVDVAFSPAGDTLWVLSGDTPRSRASGPQPTELRALRLGASPESLAKLEIARVVTVAAARDPARIAVGRAPPLVSGAAIRLPPERATVFFAASHPSRPKARPRRRARDAGAPHRSRRGGRVPRRRRGRRDRRASPRWAAWALPDLSFDGRWLLAPVQATDGPVRVLSAAVDGRPAPRPRRSTSCAPGPARRRPAARPLPQLRIQP